MGSNMAAEHQQKHLSLRFATKACESLEELKNIKVIFFLIHELVEIAKFPEISHFCNQHDSSLGRHVNAASRKSLEIQV